MDYWLLYTTPPQWASSPRSCSSLLSLGQTKAKHLLPCEILSALICLLILTHLYSCLFILKKTPASLWSHSIHSQASDHDGVFHSFHCLDGFRFPKHLGSSWAVHFRHRGQPSAVTSCQPCLLHLEENIRKHGSLRLSYFDDRLQGRTEERSLREGSSDACRMGKTQAIRDDGHWGVQAEGSSWEADSISWPREMGRDGWPGSAWNNSQSALSL